MTYVYACEKCGNFEVEQNIKDEALKICPNCNTPVRRVIQPVGIIYKCGGFYSKPVGDIKDKG